MPPSPPRPPSSERSPKNSGSKTPPPARSPTHGGSSNSGGGAPKSPKSSSAPTGGTTLRLNLGGSKPSSPKRASSPKPPPSSAERSIHTNKSNSNSPTNSAATPTSSTNTPSSSPNKKRKFNQNQANVAPHLAMASFVRVHHQSSHLQWVLTEAGTWTCRASSTLYMSDTAPPLPTTTQLAFHLRGTCLVDAVHVETVGASVPPKEFLEKLEASSSTTTSSTAMTTKLETWKTMVDHIDPMEHVLIKPALSYTETDFVDNNTASSGGSAEKKQHYDADAQWTRGTTGMTTGLRAASMASNMGELRLTIDRPSNAAGRPPLDTFTKLTPEEKKQRQDWFTHQWHADLEATTALTDNKNGTVGRELHQQLLDRTAQRRAARLKLVAQRMAEASDTEHGRRAFKITVNYRIHPDVLETELHAGGLHVVPTSTHFPPHVYTTAGVFGDHEGVRNWLPCLDSASYKHRCSQQLTMYVTAPMREGLQVIGCGEDFGIHDTWLHFKSDDHSERRRLLEEYLGLQQVQWIDKNLKQHQEPPPGNSHNKPSTSSAPHVIPPDTDVAMGEASNGEDQAMDQQPKMNVVSINQILATQIWATTSWLPIPARSMGFAVGPFHIVEDPEYFGLPEIDFDDEENMALKEDVGDANLRRRRQVELERERERIEDARVRGEGIRQAYFAPLYERKYIHSSAKALLLEDSPNPGQAEADAAAEDEEDDVLAALTASRSVEFQMAPQTSRHRFLSKGLQDAVLFATAGVAHRALSLMRDLLALPAYRTASYTQIWIPHAVNGGYSCGALHSCPEVLGANTFLGGAIMDAGLLPPPGKRIPFYQGGGRVLQMLQARCAIRGWIIACLPLGGQDDVGNGYILSLIESFMMSLYERAHGATGEGGAKGSLFHTKRFSAGSGLNSTNLDFLPVRNVEEIVDVAVGGVMAAVPVEDRNNDQLWRSQSNGTESHTSSMDEFAVRQLLCKDAVDVLERGTDKDRYAPMPSMSWLGSHLCLSFLSSNATSSSDLGGGALELVHPTGGLVYRSLKTEVFARIVEGRAGVANFIRLVRAAFVASHLDDMGEQELKMPSTKKDKRSDRKSTDSGAGAPKPNEPEPSAKDKPRFVICVNEFLKKKGLTHTLFTRALQNLAGRIREALLLGRLVDADKETIDPRTKLPLVDPEGFPNSFVRAASSLYLRVGVHVEIARDSNPASAAANPGGIQLQAYAEPIIPEGGVAYSGPITIRVVENEGQFREFVKDLTLDGSRRDWGTTHLHAKPVTTPKAQTAASGVIETTAAKDKVGGAAKGIFGASIMHGGGYQAIELIRLTNLTPLLWVRVDPNGLYGGRISVFQPDSCLAEQLFHDGDAGAQVEAMRHLAERPLRIQGALKVNSVYDVKVSELPVRILGDCLRGSPALHSSLPHTPAVRVQAALAIAQWQNNKAPQTSAALGLDSWIGMSILIQYFKERYYSNGIVMPVKFTRIVLRKNEVEAAHEAAGDGAANPNPKEDLSYQYLDSYEDGADRVSALEEAEEIGVEEDEEYRVRSAVITAIASIRAQDGMTPRLVLQFLETILEGEDTEMAGNVVYPDEDVISETKSRRKANDNSRTSHGFDDVTLAPYPYVSSVLVADSLLALCHIHAAPALITDPATGKPVQSTAIHPVSKLMEISLRWLNWELYRESIRAEAESETMTGVAGKCCDTVAACAITALSSLAILRQSTTDPPVEKPKEAAAEKKEEGAADDDEAISEEQQRRDKLDEVTTAKFYVEIFDRDPPVSDLTRAACAQAVACIFCASDRFEQTDVPPTGLLAALEFLLDRINDPSTSVSLKSTLSVLMMDACTGKICSMQRVAAIGGRNELVTSAARFHNGPLGASHGGDSGSACFMSISPATYPAANSVNDGARRGLRLLSRAGHPKETYTQEIVVRIARFATNLWRTINGEFVLPQRKEVPTSLRQTSSLVNGVCAYDGHLRCSLLSLWQWIWSSRCLAILMVQAWKSHEGTKRYAALGAHHVMKCTDEEKQAATAEEVSLDGINRLVNVELERQKWRGEMAIKAFEFNKNSGAKIDISAAEQGIGQPLPPIQRDTAFKTGGWVASAAQQRRAMALDGGTAVTKLRLTVKSSD